MHQSHGHGFESPVSYKSKDKGKLYPWDEILRGKDKNMQNPPYEVAVWGGGKGRDDKFHDGEGREGCRT